MTAAQDLEKVRIFWQEWVEEAHRLADYAGYCETYDQIIEDATRAVPVPEVLMSPIPEHKEYKARRKVRWVVEYYEEDGIGEFRVEDDALLRRAAQECLEGIDSLAVGHLIEALQQIQRDQFNQLMGWEQMRFPGYEVTVEVEDADDWLIFEDE